MLKSSKHNFGAGAGYTIGIKGIPLTKTFDIISVEENAEWDTLDVHFDVAVTDGYCDKWETEDYYNGVTSDSEYLVEDEESDDGESFISYGSEDLKIEGGVIHCYTEINNGDLQAWRGNYEDGHELSQKDLIKIYLRDVLPKECDLYGAFGGGWFHSNLKDETIDFKTMLNEEYKHTDLYLDQYDIMIFGAEIKAPEIVADINWFYEHDFEIKEFFSHKKNILKRKYARRSLR